MKAVENFTPVEGRTEHATAMDLAGDTAATVSCPIVLVFSHLYCPQDDFQTASDLKSFGEDVISEQGQQAAADVSGSVPMSESLRAAAQEALDQMTVAD